MAQAAPMPVGDKKKKAKGALYVSDLGERTRCVGVWD